MLKIVTLAGSTTTKYSHTGSRIPLELYPHIIDYIDDTATLLSMLLLSKSIHSQAERKLYHTIKPWRSRAGAHRLFVGSVLDPKRPQLARFVHHYYLGRAPFSSSGFNAQLTHALATFVNLKYLSFWGWDAHRSARVLPIKTPCPFQLQTFRWYGGTDLSYLTAFLNTQHSLEELWLLSMPASFQVPTTSMKRLRTLRGSMDVIARILPGHDSVTCLGWELDGLSFNISLMPSFSHIRILSFGILGPRPVLGAIIILLEDLEILHLGGLDRIESVDLYKLTCLHTLVINYCQLSDESFDPQEAFDKMKNLERIDIGNLPFEGVSIKYERRIRGVQEPREISASKVIYAPTCAMYRVILYTVP